ncbi:MAG: ExbD/TolR family protein [Cellvibrionaceae bacterium]
MKFRRQKNKEEDVNLTPLIDIVFLLLIFFMVSTTFTKETHLDIDLPEASGEPVADQQQQIDVLINADGGYAINGQSLANKKLMTLRSAIETVSGGDSELPLIITADANTPHQAVVTAMDAAGQLGFAKLSITTKNPASEENDGS